jgi:hypothetical protein
VSQAFFPAPESFPGRPAAYGTKVFYPAIAEATATKEEKTSRRRGRNRAPREHALVYHYRETFSGSARTPSTSRGAAKNYTASGSKIFIFF